MRKIRLITRLVSVTLATITVVSLWIAIQHRQKTKLATKSLSTQYIETFPSYLPELTKLVDSASDTLLIVTDLSGYGSYSDHRRYLDYQAALERKVGLREFKVVVLNATGVKNLISAQFLGQDFGRDVKPSDHFKEFVKWSRYRDKEPQDMESFQQALQGTEEISRHDFGAKGIKCLETSGPMPLYVWIADGKMAVFSIPDLHTPKPEENAFITHDSRLINQLITVFRTYEDGASPATDVVNPTTEMGSNSRSIRPQD